MHRLLYFVFNIYKQIVIYRTCVDHQLVNTQNLRGSDLLRWSNGLRLNVGSLIRTVEIEIVNHYVTTKHILTWQAHQKLYLRIRIHSSHLVPFLSVLGRRCDLHHGMKKMRLEKVSSPHEWSKLFINSWFAFSTILLAFF